MYITHSIYQLRKLIPSLDFKTRLQLLEKIKPNISQMSSSEHSSKLARCLLESFVRDKTGSKFPEPVMSHLTPILKELLINSNDNKYSIDVLKNSLKTLRLNYEIINDIPEDKFIELLTENPNFVKTVTMCFKRETTKGFQHFNAIFKNLGSLVKSKSGSNFLTISIKMFPMKQIHYIVFSLCANIDEWIQFSSATLLYKDLLRTLNIGLRGKITQAILLKIKNICLRDSNSGYEHVIRVALDNISEDYIEHFILTLKGSFVIISQKNQSHVYMKTLMTRAKGNALKILSDELLQVEALKEMNFNFIETMINLDKCDFGRDLVEKYRKSIEIRKILGSFLREE